MFQFDIGAYNISDFTSPKTVKTFTEVYVYVFSNCTYFLIKSYYTHNCYTFNFK